MVQQPHCGFRVEEERVFVANRLSWQLQTVVHSGIAAASQRIEIQTVGLSWLDAILDHTLFLGR